MENGSGQGGSQETELFLCGDVMVGRGIDQILQHPSNPGIYESYMKSAEGYVHIAEQKLGHPLPRRVSNEYIWGDALRELQRRPNALRIINLETAITASEVHWPDKGIQYRMNPKNVGVLSAARIDGCVLANNHVLDWGYDGLRETLSTLKANGIQVTGAGERVESASKPAILTSAAGRTVVVLGIGTASAGVPEQWAASSIRPGVNFCLSPDARAVEIVKRQLKDCLHKAGVIVVVSVHWGPNWGYDVTEEERKFAHDLIDTGVHIVHGHSSHHIKALEVYQSRLILYGCGDFLNDYEGIGHHFAEEQFRSEICLMYFPKIGADGNLKQLQLVPMQIKEFRVQKPPPDAIDWVQMVLNREGARFDKARVAKSVDGVSLEVVL